MVREDAHPPNCAPCATLGPLYSRVHVLQTVLNFETYVAWLGASWRGADPRRGRMTVARLIGPGSRHVAGSLRRDRRKLGGRGRDVQANTVLRGWGHRNVRRLQPGWGADRLRDGGAQCPHPRNTRRQRDRVTCSPFGDRGRRLPPVHGLQPGRQPPHHVITRQHGAGVGHRRRSPARRSGASVVGRVRPLQP